MARRAPTTERTRRPSVPRRPNVKRTEVDGVPTFWLDAPPPFRAMLVFRVGQADEVLPQAGISHLVEHLAFSAMEDLDHAHNGFVEHDRTAFWAAGEVDEVVEFMNGITSALSDPAFRRIEAERQILSVEARSRGRSLVGSMLSCRYGARGPGLVGYDELGLNWLDAEHVRMWSARYFTGDNAVLWMTGPVPRGLRLDLPAGERRPRPTPIPADLATPTCFVEGQNVIGLGALVPKTTPAMSTVRILERRLQRRLRRDLGVSYNASTGYMRVEDETVHVAMAADIVPERASEALREVLEVAEEIASEGVTEDEVERDVTLMFRAYGGEDSAFGWLDAFAHAELYGDPEPKRPSEAARELRAADTDTHSSIAANLLDTAIGFVPIGSEIPPWRFTHANAWSSGRVLGTKHDAIHSDAPGRYLVVGEDGVTLVVEEDKVVTVRFDACEAVSVWDDGSRVLWGRDGFVIGFRPWHWKAGKTIPDVIDARVPADRRVHIGEGSGPPPQQPTPMQVELARTRPGFKIAGFVVWVMGSVAAIVGALLPPEPPARFPAYECRQKPSVVVALEGPDPTAPSLLLDHECVDQAQGMAVVGGVGLLSAGGATVVAVRRWRRRQAATA